MKNDKGRVKFVKKNITLDEALAQISFLKKQVKVLGEKAFKSENKYEEAKQQVEDLTVQNKELQVNYNWLLEQLKLSKKKMYGASAEKIAEEYGQLNLFNEAELERQPMQAEPQIEEITYTRKKSKKKSFDEKYGDLPVEEVISDIPDEEKICEKCNDEMTFMKYEIRRELKIVPAKVTVVEYKKAVYVCKSCDKNGIESNFKTAEITPALIEKSIVSPNMMAYIMNQKFSCAMPLFRQEQEFKRMGIKLSRQTMSNWMISGANLLKPLYEKLREHLALQQLIHADETPVEVLCEDGKEPTAKSYMWVYRTSRYTENSAVLYKYEVGRSGDFAKKFLENFSGYIHCDGWSGYDKVPNSKRCGCWVHLRRYFINALEIQSDKKDYTTLAGQALLKIREIFKAEKLDLEKLSEKSQYSLDEIAEIRKNKSTELVADFFEFCDKNQGISLPKSLLGRAFTYALNQRSTLETFLENPQIELTNNAAERAVKPFVIGRKNWLFCYSPAGAQASAIIYSIIETAKANGLNPMDYLANIFEGIRSGKKADELMPWTI